MNETVRVDIRAKAPSTDTDTAKFKLSLHWPEDGSTEQGLSVHAMCVSLVHDIARQFEDPIAACAWRSVVPKSAPKRLMV